jgi:ubiquinone/menaquinone biosynthesis C-methylase UbiE
MMMRTSVREVFAAAAAAYDRGNPLLALERPETEALLPVLAGRDVLDLGAGTGHYARLAGALGARLAIAFDLTPEMLERAPRPSVVGDAGRLPIASGSVDVVVAALLLSFVADLESTLREVARALRPGGMLIASDLHEAATRRGWHRSFAGSNGERLVIDAPPPRAGRLRAALERAGLALETVVEPAIDERLRAAFESAGRSDFETLRGTPLLRIFRARKERHGA